MISLVLPDGRGLGGVTTWAIDLSARAAAAGRPVRLIEHSPESGVIHDGSSLDTHKSPHPNDPRLTSKDVAHFADRYNSHSGAQILVPNWSWGSHAAAVATLQSNPNARVLGFAHADGQDYYDWISYYEPTMSRIVAVSEEIAERLRRELPHRSGDIDVLPYAVDCPPSHSRASDRGDEITVVYAGRIAISQKRVLDLIDVARRLSDHEVGYRLRIIGNGPEEQALQREIDALPPGVRSRIERRPAVAPSEMSAVWNEADVLLLTSSHEGTSIAMLEAMANGVVPVVTSVSGTAAVIEDEINGFTCAVGDTGGLARRIKELASDRQCLDRMSRAAHQTMLGRMSVQQYDEALHQIASKCLESPQPKLPDTWSHLPPAKLRSDLGDAIAMFRGDRDAAKRVLFRAAATPGVKWSLRAAPSAKRILDRRRP